MKPDIYYDLPFSEYIKIDAINNSVLKAMVSHSPRHARCLFLHPPDTADLAFGRLYHTLLLEPDRFGDTYTVGPEVRRNTKEWKQYAADASAKGLQPIQTKEWSAANQFAAAIKQQYTHRFVQSGKAEVTLLWVDDEPYEVFLQDPDTKECHDLRFEPTGLLCKARVDYVHAQADAGALDILCDLKGAQSVLYHHVQHDIAKFGYYQQAAMCSEGWRHLTGKEPAFNFLFVQKCPVAFDPEHWHYDSVIDEVQAPSIAVGRAAYHTALRWWKKCTEEDYWPGVAETVRRLNLADWDQSKIIKNIKRLSA